MKTAIALILCTLLAGCVTTPADARKQAIERKLDEVVIPEINFRAVGPDCVMKFLEDASIEYGKGGKGVSIVLIRPESPIHPAPVAASDPFANDLLAEDPYASGIFLNIHDVSLREALNIICEVGGMTWKVEDSVVKVRVKEVKVSPQPPK